MPVKLALGAAAAVAIALAAAACGSSHQAIAPRVSATRFLAGGAVRCTATVTTPVQVGHELDVVIRLHNKSTRSARLPDPAPKSWMSVNNRDGAIYDSRAEWGDAGPTGGPYTIGPGATFTKHLSLPIRWKGPLRIAPGCAGAALHALHVPVTSPGLPASQSQAVSDVLAAAGHMLDHCRPRTAGHAVVGWIEAPSGNAPPLHARCSVSLQRERGFYLAHVLAVTPPNLRSVHVERWPTYEYVRIPSPAHWRRLHIVSHHNAEGIAWEFVVTRRGATSVDSASTARTVGRTGSGGRTIPSGAWTRGGWRRERGGDSCGDVLGGWSGASGPTVAFVTVCR